MSRNVTIMSCNGYKYVRVCESYRNAEGKPRSKVIENHGRLDQLEAKDPEYVAKLRERVRQENEAAKAAYALNLENAAQSRIRRLESLSQGTADYGFAEPINIGSALLRQIWKEDLNLPQVFRYLQSKTEISYSYDQAAFLLTAQRILRPGSKKKAFEFRNSDIIPCDIDNLNVVYRILDRLSADKPAIIKHLNREINKKLKRSITAAFYDVTTYAFESRKADDLRNFGLSKDHKVNEVQVVLGLVMDEHGIPIDYDLFLGNTSEFSTMLPIIKRIRKDYELKKLVVVADRGLNSNEKLTELIKMGCDFVLAQKIRNCKQEQRDQILDDADWENVISEQDGVVLCRYKTLAMKKPLYETRINPETGRKSQSRKAGEEMDVRWIVSYSQARANKDLADLERSIEKAQKALDQKTSLTSSRGYKSLIVTPKGEGQPRLNQDKIDDARRWAGYYAVCTNLETKTPSEIMGIYRHLWQIEDCFRVSKTTLEARPCFVWTKEHIEGHFMSCFISLVIEKYLRHVLKSKLPEITNDEINTALRTALLAYDNGNPQVPMYLRLYSSESRFDDMLRTFGLEPPCRYETPMSLRKKLRLKTVYPGKPKA